jgi:hypothetical protein
VSGFIHAFELRELLVGERGVRPIYEEQN